MSRCFPFPPPGYELKARPDDVNLIIKDKYKHKKHKHKKEKDKKEGSERKEKERSENKHKEEKKRKRKEEKDKKDKEDKNKDKQSSFGEFLENQNGQKLVPDAVQLGKVQENGNDLLAIKDIRDRNRAVNDQSLSFWELDKVEKTTEGKESIIKDTVTKVKDKKTKEEKDHIKKEEKRKRKGEKRERKEQEKMENNDCQGKLPKLKEFNDFLDAKDSGVRIYNMSRPAIVSHKVGHTGSGFRPTQNTINSSVGERAADQKVNLSSPQSVIDGLRNIRPCQPANNRKTESGTVSVSVVSNGIISPHIVRIERRVEPCLTGRSNGAAMIKQVNHSANKKIPSLHPFLADDGKIMHNKESWMNDSLEGKKPSSSMPSSVCLKENLKGKAKVATITKPPHPDTKYLNQILSVPRVEWPQCDDDQGWLFESQLKRTKLAASDIQSTKQVWSEAVELESADVTALPYVIPY